MHINKQDNFISKYFCSRKCAYQWKQQILSVYVKSILVVKVTTGHLQKEFLYKLSIVEHYLLKKLSTYPVTEVHFVTLISSL